MLRVASDALGRFLAFVVCRAIDRGCKRAGAGVQVRVREFVNQFTRILPLGRRTVESAVTCGLQAR